MPKTVEDVIYQLFEDMILETLIIWADLFEVGHNEDEWFKDEWLDRESELRQEVTEAAITIFKKGGLNANQDKET